MEVKRQGVSSKMTHLDEQITIIWENDCGEIIFEENRTADEVFDIVQNDMRADYNMYVLPSGEELDCVEFYDWYVDAHAVLA
jgi:hypothetical protein